MAKRKAFEDGHSESTVAKRRRRSIISEEHKNPSDAEGNAQCFKSVKVKMNVAVAPLFSFSMAAGIRQQHLDPLVMNYYGPAGGVIISHSDLKLLGQDPHGTGRSAAKVIGDSPFSWIWIESRLLTWAPAKGDIIEGWISIQSPGHIALLIHDTFNATIRRDDIPSSWTFVPSEDDERMDTKSMGYWTDASGNRIDGKLAFTVKVFNYSGRTVHVLGTLLTSDDVRLPSISESSAANHTQFTDAKRGKHKTFDDEPVSTATTEASTVDQPEAIDEEIVAVEPNTSDEESDSS